MRKTNLHRLLARRIDGIHLAPFEQVEIGPVCHAYLMVGLEGLVSNIGRALSAGGAPDRWIKAEPAASGVQPPFIKLIHHPWGAPPMSDGKNR
jgi:hypothetical protein